MSTRSQLLALGVVLVVLTGALVYVVTRGKPGTPVAAAPTTAAPSSGTRGSTGPTASAAPVPTGPLPPGGPNVAVPKTGVYFGAYTFAGQAGREGSMTTLEKQIGRQFDIDHRFYAWDSDFPTVLDTASAAKGRIQFWNWSSKRQDKSQVMWADIAAGKQDAVIDARARAVRAFHRPVFIAFQHEPGAQVGKEPGDAGSPTDYRNAWRHIVQRFKADGATNVSWTWILTAFNYSKGNPDRMYPGDDVIDWVAADGYNSFACFNKPWASFEKIYADYYAWGTKHNKPLMSAEYGVIEDPAHPGRKGQWYQELARTLQKWPRIKAMVYFNSAPACENWVTSSPSALAGFKSLASDSYVSRARLVR